MTLFAAMVTARMVSNMRLIDADEAIERIEKEIESINAKIEEWERNRKDREGRYDVDARIKQYKRDIISCRSDISALRSYSTVDAEPVRHGTWEEFDCDYGCTPGVGYYCSECGHAEMTKHPYCNCGAKMDGD